MSHESICLVLPYYGQWPGNFQLYLESCRHNPTVDFLFITDLEKPAEYPTNVRFVHMTLREVSQLASTRLSLDIHLAAPYKLCDFKPAYGMIFAEQLEGYEFWGHSDLDVIFGDVRKFITADLLSQNDVISGRTQFISGPFTLFRNAVPATELFRTNPAHAEILQCDANLAFDETLWQGAADWRRQHGLSADEPLPSMTTIVRQAAAEGKIRAHFGSFLKEVIRLGEAVTIERGRVADPRREYVLYHMYAEKNRAAFTYPRWASIPERYFVRRTGFYREHEHQGLGQMFRALNRQLTGHVRRRAA